MSEYDDDADHLSDICDNCGKMMAHCDCTEEDFVDHESPAIFPDEPERAIEYRDGYLIADDGEVLGVIAPNGQPVTKMHMPFHVTDACSAEWVLQKLMDCDAQVAAVQAKRTAILLNLGHAQAAQERRKAWLLWRFGDELVELARSRLQGKAKTWTCAYGAIKFRIEPPKVTVLDMNGAVAWARALGLPVHVEERILIPEIKAHALHDPPPCLEVRQGGGEIVKIESGVK